jgi:hypothetical protein
MGSVDGYKHGLASFTYSVEIVFQNEEQVLLVVTSP